MTKFASSELLGRVTTAVSSLLSGIDLGQKLADCYAGTGPTGPPTVAPPPPVDAINAYLDEMDDVSTNLTGALSQILQANLAPLLPDDRGVLTTVNAGRLQAFEVNGDPYLDPRNGQPLNVALTDLVDARMLSDSVFRTSVLNQLRTGLNQYSPEFARTNLTFAAARAALATIQNQLNRFYQLQGTHVLSAPVYYFISDAMTGGVIAQGRTSASGSVDVVVPPNIFLRVRVYDPISGTFAETAAHSPASGQEVFLSPPRLLNDLPADQLPAAPAPPITLAPDGSPDSDGDGLSDFAESVIGTDPHKWSTAADGISDRAKVAQGLDPLSGAVAATGVIASLPLPGVAKEIVLSGSTITAGEQTAYVACGPRGLSIVNASKFQMPILLGQLDLPGDATDVAVDSSLQIAVVAAKAGGLYFVNGANPMQPQLIGTLGINASQVEVVRGIAYVAVGAQIWSYDIATGSLLQTLTLGGANLVGLSSEGLFVYSIDANRVLRAVDITEPVNMVARGSLSLPNGTGRLFVGNGVAYLAAETAFPGGFATADVSNPESLTLLSDVDANNVAGKAVVPNGSGFAVAVGSPGNFGNVLDVMNVSNPTNTGAFLTRYALPADPFSVAIGSGIAFVADGTAGLQVVNYRSFDNQGVPPTISLATSFQLLTPTTGIVEEGKSVRVAAITTDDVQVRDVEFYIDGVKQLTDVSFPFEDRLVAPTRTASKTNFTLQAKATDTGGNTNWTPMIDVALVPDATPPQVSRTFPDKYGFVGSSDRIAAYFSEPVQPVTLTAGTVRLKFLGADGIAGTADDVAIINGGISYRDDLNAVFLQFPTNLALGAYEATISPPIADLAGNPMVSAYSWKFYVLGTQDSDQDGLPDIVEIVLGLDPAKASTYDDGILDGNRDLNGDGLRAVWKLRYGYDPKLRDSLGDGILDKDRDPDHDTLTNLSEQNYGTDPFKADTDADGWTDESEITASSNPLDPLSRPKLFVAANPDVKVALPTFSAAGSQLVNTFVASPPVSVALPGSGDPVGIPLNTIIAYPPVQVSLTVLDGSSGSLLNTVVAQPPIHVMLLELGDTEGFPFNTVIAQPPVNIQLPAP